MGGADIHQDSHISVYFAGSDVRPVHCPDTSVESIGINDDTVSNVFGFVTIVLVKTSVRRQNQYYSYRRRLTVQLTV